MGMIALREVRNAVQSRPDRAPIFDAWGFAVAPAASLAVLTGRRAFVNFLLRLADGHAVKALLITTPPGVSRAFLEQLDTELEAGDLRKWRNWQTRWT